MSVKYVIRATIDPIRQNTLRARRRKLGLSRVALGRILGVDPATVFRHERGRMDALWDYALRGIEAEAAEGKQSRRQYKTELDLQTFIPDQLDAWLVIHCGKNTRGATTTRPEKGAPRRAGQKARRALSASAGRGKYPKVADEADSRRG